MFGLRKFPFFSLKNDNITKESIYLATESKVSESSFF